MFANRFEAIWRLQLVDEFSYGPDLSEGHDVVKAEFTKACLVISLV